MSAMEQLIEWNAKPGQEDTYIAPQARAELAALEAAVRKAQWVANAAVEFLQLVVNENKSEYSVNIHAWIIALAAHPAPAATGGDEMKLTDSQIKMLDDIAMGRKTLVMSWRTTEALTKRGLIAHNDATWKYPEPYYRLTDLGIAEWITHTVKE